MTNTVGNPSMTINESGGWGLHTADISSYAGQNIEALFHLDSDTTVQLAGLAIDDVSVTACQQVLEPSIVLTKTVGLSPLSCATTDQINLPYGGDNVTYCYEVENTGNVSFNTHDLTDSELGPILTGYSYLLAPGASVFVTETAYIGFTTVNTGMWTAYNTNEGGGGQATASDTATVTVDLPAPAIVLTKTVGTDATVCATTDDITVPANTDVTYCYTVENTGNAAFDVHDLNDSELGVLLNNFYYYLAPGASAFITATTNIAVTTVNTATWYAEMQPKEGFPSAQATDVATVTVQAPSQPAIDLNKTVGTVPGVSATTNKVTVPAGTEVYYCYQIENTGNVTFTYHSLVDSELGTLASNLPYVLPPGAFSPPQIVPETINITTTNVATWTAVSSLGGYVVEHQCHVQLHPDPTPAARPWASPMTAKPTSTSRGEPPSSASRRTTCASATTAASCSTPPPATCRSPTLRCPSPARPCRSCPSGTTSTATPATSTGRSRARRRTAC